MSTWTEDEIELATKYGFCEFCGGARTVRAERSEAEPGVFYLLLTCSRCGREAT